MKLFLTVGFALFLTACASIPNTSRTVFTRVLLSEHTIGGQGYPVVIRGAETVGLTPVMVAQGIKFPPRLQRRTSLRVVPDSAGLGGHATLDITPVGNNAEGRLTFLRGDRRIGVGVFTLTKEDWANQNKLSNTTATLIIDMLIDAQQDLRNDDRSIFIPY